MIAAKAMSDNDEIRTPFFFHPLAPSGTHGTGDPTPNSREPVQPSNRKTTVEPENQEVACVLCCGTVEVSAESACEFQESPFPFLHDVKKVSSTIIMIGTYQRNPSTDPSRF